MRNRLARLFALGAAAASVAALSPAAPLSPARAAEPTRPNVLLVVLDDATLQMALDMLGDSRARIVGNTGVDYRNSYVAIPSCCPERGTLLTGQFPHNSGVRQQDLGVQLDKTTTLPADLHRAGYRTYHVGKLVHEAVQTAPPPGVFDKWLIGMGTYTDPTFNLNGTVRKVPGYTTTITGNYARQFLADAQTVNDEVPWYISVNFKAPHGPSEPEAKYATLPVPALTFPDEADRSDKPPYVRNMNITRSAAEAERLAMWRTVASVDDQIVSTINWLASNGELANTLIMLTSDNGYHNGQMRRKSKFVPYTPSVRVPMWIRGPGVTARGVNTTRMVSGVDVATTVYAATGANPSRTVDGENLLAPARRSEVLVEYFHDTANAEKIGSWATVRGRTFQYIENYSIDTGALAFREWYDLTADPHQMTNLLADGNPANDPDTSAVASRLRAYRTCVGAACIG